MNKDSSPLVSIIVPAYNAAQWIGRCLDSLRAQTYGNLEIIVVDDGSTDNTAEVCEAYGRTLRYFKQPNLGVSAARNLGVKKANGSLIGFLDSDDEYFPHKVSLLVEALNKWPDAAAATGAIIRHSPAGEERFPPLGSTPSGQVSTYKLWADRFNIPDTRSCLIRKTVLDAVGSFREDLRIGEDQEMWCRIEGRFDWVYVDDVVAVYYNLEASSVTIKNPVAILALEYVYSNAEIKQYVLPPKRSLYLQYRQATCLGCLPGLVKNRMWKRVLSCAWLGFPPPWRWAYFREISVLIIPIWLRQSRLAMLKRLGLRSQI